MEVRSLSFPFSPSSFQPLREHTLLKVISYLNTLTVELRYEGEWKNGQREGKGKQLFGRKDGSGRVSYEGEWKAGRREGHGVMLWRDGSVYMGQWAAGRREGYGVFYDPTLNGGEKYLGMWKDDKQEDLEGRLVDKNGDEYKGPFVDGKRHGEGVFVFRHGRRVKQVWHQGGKVQCPLPAPIARHWFPGGKVPQSECASKTGRVQSLVVLCIEAIGNNPRLLKQLGMKRTSLFGERTKDLFNHSKKVAKQAWQANVQPGGKEDSKNAMPISLYSSLLAAAPSAMTSSFFSSPSSSSSSSSSHSLLLPMELMESLHFFLSSRQAKKVAAQEKRAQRGIKPFPNPFILLGYPEHVPL